MNRKSSTDSYGTGALFWVMWSYLHGLRNADREGGAEGQLTDGDGNPVVFPTSMMDLLSDDIDEQ